MASFPQWAGPALTSAEQAIDVGYAEGTQMRADDGARSEAVDEIRTNKFERPYPFDRGDRNEYIAAWRRGFNAGFLGEPKPAREQ